MNVWEADFYRRPLQDKTGRSLWELLICDTTGKLQFEAVCPQSEVSADWLVLRLQQFVSASPTRPDQIRVFRPQTLNLMAVAGPTLGIAVEPTRRTPALKQWLTQRWHDSSSSSGQPYNPLELDKPAPLPLPENLWGDRWRFAALPAVELAESFTGRLIPVLEMPEFLLPLQLGLASTIPVPGVVIDGGRQSLRLARWLQAARPVSLGFIPGSPDGLILEAGLVDRWVVATFDDSEVRTAAQEFEQRKVTSQGLHFLLVQPDDSGMTYSGFWLLKPEN